MTKEEFAQAVATLDKEINSGKGNFNQLNQKITDLVLAKIALNGEFTGQEILDLAGQIRSLDRLRNNLFNEE